MEPSGPTSGIAQTLSGLHRPAALQLQIGQQLQATVLDNSAGKILLAIGHRQLSAESSLPFERGQALTLQVRSLGEQPVLKVIAAIQESPATMAIRTLLARYGASTPLLASLSQLAQTPRLPVPPLIGEAARALMRQLPDVATLSAPQGVKTAIQQSGGFLENHLARQGQVAPTDVNIDSDFKANLVRLFQLLRQWPDSTQTPTQQRPATPPAPAGGPAIAQPPGAPAPPTTPSGPAQAPTSSAAPSGTDTATGTQAANPQTVQRAIQNAVNPPVPRPGVPQPVGAGTPLSTTAGARSANPAIAATSGLYPPPPFTGVVPTPQAPVQASLELINRLGNLRLDLLQQTEAALARVQLNQLASLPREGEQRLLEWLFDLPIRRGNDIDLWSARLYRDAEGETKTHDRPEAQWHVQLAFDLPGLGPMQAQINLHGERVSTHFWASRQDTLPLLRDNLHALRAAMLEAGLDVADIDCQLGSIPATPGRSSPPLISEKA